MCIILNICAYKNHKKPTSKCNIKMKVLLYLKWDGMTHMYCSFQLLLTMQNIFCEMG